MRNIIVTGDEDFATCKASVKTYCKHPTAHEGYLLTAENEVLKTEDSNYQVDLEQQVEGLHGLCSLTYELQLDALCLVFTSGHILLLDPLDTIVEEVGLVEGGIIAASWSPDGELLAVVTGLGLLLLFNKAFDVLSESSAQAWPTRLVPSRKVPEKEENKGLLSASIAWRGDGQFLAVVTKATSASQAVLRVWERDDCSLHTIGEDTPGLLVSVSWQPNGRHIYAAQEVDGEQRVVLFERNGLTHGSFTTASKASSSGGKVVRLQWSQEGSNMLTASCQEGNIRQVEMQLGHSVSKLGTSAVIDGSKLQITPLRHCVIPPPLSAVTAAFPCNITCLAFLNDSKAEVVACAMVGGSLALIRSSDMDFWEETSEEITDSSENESMEAQPILLDTEASLQDFCIRCLAWSGPKRLLAVAADIEAHQDVLLEIDIPDLSGSPIQARLAGRRLLRESLLNVVSGPHDSALLQDQTGKCQLYVVSQKIRDMASFPEPCSWVAAVATEGVTVAVGLSAEGKLYLGSQVIAQSVTSAIVRHAGEGNPTYLLYTSEDNFLHTRPFLDLILDEKEGQRPAASSMQNGSLSHHRGLGEGRWRDNHYTDMHAAMRGHGTALPSSGNILKARAVEQGSKIVAAPPDDICVVLELPRGNLETIYPRSLVLPAIASAVQGGDFSKAWQLATAHRADLNLLVDYCWPDFLANAGNFVDQVSDDQDIVDLLSALREDSVVSEGGLYAGLPPSNTSSLQAPPEAQKVKILNQALQEAMQARGSDLYLRPLVTSHASQGELEKALQLIKDAKEAQLAREASNCFASSSGEDHLAEISMGQGPLGKHRRAHAKQMPTAEDALNHLLLTVEVEQLYRASLGMYELELAYMVVAHSQRDPGEYLLELQGFAAKPEGPLREYAINLHLQRYSAAIRNLLAAGDSHFPQAVALARKEGKLRELLSLVGDSTENAGKRQQVLAEYAGWLSERHMREDAAVTYTAAGDLPSALAAYQEGNHWRMALFLAGRLGYSKDQIVDLADSFVNSLSASSRLGEAALVATEYLQDADTAVSLHCQARGWQEALRIAAMFQRQDLVETTIAPQAAESASTLMEELQDTAERIVKYDARLKEVREKRAAMAAALEDAGGEQAEMGEFDETASEGGSSMVSGLSMYTQATTARGSTAMGSSIAASTIGGRMPQKKQKKARRGPRIRQGSPQEEEALVGHIVSLAPTPQTCTEVSQLTEMLIFLGHEADARKLQALLSEVLTNQKAAADRAKEGFTGAEANAKKSVSAAEGVDWKWDILRPVQHA